MKRVFINGKIYLERDKFAEAVVICGDRIQSVGTTEEILKECELSPDYDKDKIEVIDCAGRTVIPGLNDSHMHFMQLGETMYQANIGDCKSIDEIIEECRKFIRDYPQRVTKGLHATGWNQDMFVDGDRMPDKNDLDRISTQIPIVLERVCGHIVSSNSKIIDMLGIDGKSPQFPGGSFLIGDDGEPNGLFTANACNIVKDLIPDFTMEQRHEMLLKTMDYAVSCGLTSVQSNDVGTVIMDAPMAFKLFRDIYHKGEGKLRYRHQVCFNDINDFEDYLKKGEFAHGEYSNLKVTQESESDSPSENWLTLGPLKLFQDGSLGARTARMRKGYADDETNFGLAWISQDDMEKYCQMARDAGMQVVCHCIGDAAIEDAITTYERAFVDGENKLRHSIIHCQITDRQLLERMAKDGILTMVQPIFLDYDMNVVEDRVGKKLASTSYAFATMQRLGIHTSYGTDCPVEDCNPFPNIYQAVTRKDMSGKPEDGFYPQECVDVYTAVDAYTIESAYAMFMEDRLGRIKPGMLADMVMLDRDIFTVDSMEIKDIKPVLTMVGGQIVFDTSELTY